MNIWTGIPQTITVQHDSVLNIDADSLDVLVLLEDQPLRDAQVCVILDTVVYEYGLTDVNGGIVFYFDEQSLIPGTMDITVTGRNIYPYEGTVTIADTGAYLVYQNHTVIDSFGNNNGIPGTARPYCSERSYRTSAMQPLRTSRQNSAPSIPTYL